METLTPEIESNALGVINESDKICRDHQYPEVNEKIAHHFRQFAGKGHDFLHAELIRRLSAYIEMPDEAILPIARMSSFEAIIRSLTHYGEEIIAAGPLTDDIISTAENYQVHLKTIEFKTPFIPDISELIDSITGKTGMVLLAHPNRFTGAVFSIEDIRKLLDYKFEGQVVIDESLIEYHGYSVTRLTEQYRHLMVIRSFNDGLGLANGRIEYIVSNRTNISRINQASGSRLKHEEYIRCIGILDSLGQIKKRYDKVRERQVFLSLLLRSRGVICRPIPTGRVIAEVTDPGEVVSRFSREGIGAIDLSDFEQLSKYISIPVLQSDFRFIEKCADIAAEFSPALQSKERRKIKLVGRSETDKSVLESIKRLRNKDLISKKMEKVS